MSDRIEVKQPPWKMTIPSLASAVVTARSFHVTIVSAIIISAILIGLETSPRIAGKWGDYLKLADRFLVFLFAMEVTLKLLSQGRRFLRFFTDPWNLFDFVVVAACLIPSSPQYLVVLRLFRVLRVFRLVTTIPKLQLLVGALFKSIPSMGYVLILLSVHFYIYAVLGTYLFAVNDPWHFGSLGKSLLTLFQVVTLEGWVDVMVTQMKGCTIEIAGCTEPQAFPRIAPLYFISFIVVGTMIILNLFIGVVVGSMTEMQEELEEPLAPEEQKRKIANELTAIRTSLSRLETRISKSDTA